MRVQKASPVDLRKAKAMCDALVRAGIDFVPMVVTSEEQKQQMLKQLGVDLDAMEAAAK